MRSFISEKLDFVQKKARSAYSDITGKVTLISEVFNGLPIISSFESTESTNFDEKHYFIIPFKLSEYGIALHTMRSLPKGAAEINDLPKRRIFHFYNEHAEGQLKRYLLEQAESSVMQGQHDKISSIENLANSIDALDNKLTYGMLLVGGLSAIVNPILGATIAAKAILPSVTGLVNKHGLKPLGEKFTQSSLTSQIEQAKQKVQRDFESGNTLKLINPILHELDLALNTTEQQHDPLLDFDLSSSDIDELDSLIWRSLTIKALRHVYDEVLEDNSKHDNAQLGPEDLRWLEMLFASQDPEEQ
ncbi:hypothetical protein [Thalassotalea sp. ND16A]|uniref:hypothetical protein n=1 Tax=Thalassotalea sp. ND16A TaxID=1535422 RepID=UPI00051DFFB6|nr:hypothetical protein [Thalassotalea sp. ND16A]KGJ93404.1 hypothetical protein ND16A_1517 [Thalassotalea sp. ND16A]